MQYTVDQIKNLLNTNNVAVNRAMVALYNEQTEDEKAVGNTRNTNGRGFSYRTAPKGTYYAKWVLSGKSLTGYHLENARKIALFHAKQLTNLANAKLEQKKINNNVIEAEIVESVEHNDHYSLAMINGDGEMIVG